MLSETMHTLYHGTVRKSSKTFYPGIDANLRIGRVFPDFKYLFNLDRSIPLTATVCYGNVLYSPRDIKALVKTYPANLW